MEAIWQISAHARAIEEPAFVHCFQETFGTGVSSYLDFESDQVHVSFYSPSRPACEKVDQLERALAPLFKGRGGKPPIVSVKRLKPRDWANAWKRHFRPMTIRGCLLIRPSWSRLRAAPSVRTVILDPGLSFGTGQHPTTRFCLESIAALRPRAGAKSLLDVGTGSGILAIAASKLGYQPVNAIDYDPTAVRIAAANARRNRVKCRVAQGDVANLRRSRERHDVVCANLTTDLHLKYADQLLGAVQDDGTLLLAGILATEFGEVRGCYEALGWGVKRTRAAGEWQSGAFVAI